MLRSFISRLVRKKTRVFFVYAQEHRMSGSTVMRGFQLADMARRALGRSYRVSVVPYTHQMYNSIIIFTKGAIYSVPVGRLRELSQTNLTVFDPVDGKIDKEKLQYADAIVAASKTAFVEYPKTYPGKKIFLVYHHADPRIKAAPLKTKAEPKIGYFGELENTIITEKLKKQVDFVRTDTSSQKDLRWLKMISDYDVHYAVRKMRQFDDVKPATKIFNAARCNANVIVQDTEPEAVRWLGEDYPYLIKGNVTEKKILDMLAYARNGYRSKEWERGLKTMEKIKKQVSEESVNRQVSELIGWLSAQLTRH